MIEIPFDDIKVGQFCLIEFTGISLKQLRKTAEDYFPGDLQPSGRFYGQCVGKEDLSETLIVSVEKNSWALTWKLIDNDKVPNKGERAFYKFQSDYLGFESRQQIKYYPSFFDPEKENDRITSIVQINTKSSIVPTVPVDINTISKWKVPLPPSGENNGFNKTSNVRRKRMNGGTRKKRRNKRRKLRY